MGEFDNGQWRLDVAYNTPSGMAPTPSVRLLVTHGGVALSIDMPADAAHAAALSMVNCANESIKAHERAYGKGA